MSKAFEKTDYAIIFPSLIDLSLIQLHNVLHNCARNWRIYSIQSKRRQSDLNVLIPDKVEVKISKPKPIAHGPPIRRKFNLDIHRRVWARTAYKPAIGWPGITEEEKHNIMEYINHPPDLESTGLRSMKISLVPRNIAEDYILCSKRKSWVGIPISIVPNSNDVSSRRFSHPQKPGKKYRIKSIKCIKSIENENENESQVLLLGCSVERDAEQRRKLRAIGWSEKKNYSFLSEGKEMISDMNINSNQEEINVNSVFGSYNRIEDGNSTDQKMVKTDENTSNKNKFVFSGVMYEKNVFLPWGGYMTKFFHSHNKKENRNSKLRTVGTRNISVLSNGENDLNLLADRKVKKASHLSKKKHYRTVYSWIPQKLLHKTVNTDRLKMKSIQEEEHTEKMMSQISNNSRSLTTQQIAILSHKNEIKKLTLNRSELVDDLHAFKKCKNSCNISDSALIKERELIQKTENLKYSSGSTTSSFSEKNIKDSNEYQFTHHSSWPCTKRSRISPLNTINSTTLEIYITSEKRQEFVDFFVPPNSCQNNNCSVDKIDYSTSKTSSEHLVSNSYATLHHYHWL